MPRAADTYRELNLFGDVFERVRADYVETPDDNQPDRVGDQRDAEQRSIPIPATWTPRCLWRHADHHQGTVRRHRH